MRIRSEDNGLRAKARILGKSHTTIIGWEKRLATMKKNGLYQHQSKEMLRAK